jgi:carboxymethylenebutenolidase
MLLGADDEEVSPQRCQDVAQRSIAAGSRIDVVLYPGATHDFDDPGQCRGIGRCPEARNRFCGTMTK